MSWADLADEEDEAPRVPWASDAGKYTLPPHYTMKHNKCILSIRCISKCNYKENVSTSAYVVT